MLHKLLALPMVLILSLTTLGQLAAAQPQARDARYVAKIKSDIARRGTGRNARVTIRLHSGHELHGRIDQVGDNTFAVVDEKTGKSTSMNYAEVQSVRGRSLGKGKKIGIIAALAVGVVVLVGVLSFKNFHPFEHGVLR